MAEAIDLPDLGIALGLLIVAAGVALWQQTGLVWLVLSATSRTIAQIIVFSYLLAIVFALRTPLATGLALAGLIAVSAIVLTNRVPQKQRSWLPLASVILATTTLTTTGYAVLLVIRPVDWYDPQYWLPLAGLVAGSSLGSAAIAGERLLATVKQHRSQIETHLCLGASPKQAIAPYAREAMRAGVLPTFNSWLSFGVIALPPLMAGQMLNGASPLFAAPYQITALLVLAVAIVGTTGAIVNHLSQNCFNAAAQLMID